MEMLCSFILLDSHITFNLKKDVIGIVLRYYCANYNVSVTVIEKKTISRVIRLYDIRYRI